MALVLGLEVGAAGPTKRFSALPRPKSSSGWSSPQPVKAGWGVRCWFWRSGRLPQAHLLPFASKWSSRPRTTVVGSKGLVHAKAATPSAE